MPFSRFARRAAVVLSPFLALPALTLGCSCSAERAPFRPASVEILMPVEDVDDYAGHEREIAQIVHLFAPGSEPSLEACKRYGKYRFHGTNPSKWGDTATAVVSVKDRQTGSVGGEVTWTMKRIGGGWKLTDAPLPDEQPSCEGPS